MALIKCRECGREISDQAAACPQCGCPSAVKKPAATPPKNDSAGAVLVIIGIFILGSAYYFFTAPSTPPKPKQWVKPAHVEGWKMLFNNQTWRHVYLPPEKFEDREYVQSVLTELYGLRHASGYLQVTFYDADLPNLHWPNSTDDELLHMRANYFWNPSNKHEEFNWISNATVNGEVKIRSRKDSLRPQH